MARRTKLEAYADELIEEQLEMINERIEQLNEKLEVYDRVKAERDKLLAARRALMGTGSRLTGSGGTRTTSDEVAMWLKDNGPATYQEMATALSTSEAVIRGAISRGKDARLAKNGEGKWDVTGPEGAQGIRDAG